MYAITVPYMNLDQLYTVYSDLNWKKITDGKYIIIHKDKVVKVEQRRENILFSCSEEDFHKVWYNYFDINTDYLKLHYLYRGLGDEFKICCNRASGIRVLRLDIFEVLVRAIVKYNSRMDIEYTTTMWNIQEICGKKHKNSMGDVGVYEWREFPKPGDILNKMNKLKHSLINQKVVNDLLELSNDIVDGWFDEVLLSELSYDAAEEYLNDFKWCNDNTLRYICLFGLHDLRSFVIDKNLRKFIRKTFGMKYEKWLLYHLAGETRYIDKIGYLSQVMKYNMLNPVTESNYDFSQ